MTQRELSIDWILIVMILRVDSSVWVFPKTLLEYGGKPDSGRVIPLNFLNRKRLPSAETYACALPRLGADDRFSTDLYGSGIRDEDENWLDDGHLNFISATCAVVVCRHVIVFLVYFQN